jgi:hypothetical protein
VKDPDLPGQTLSARRALAELAEIRSHNITTTGRAIGLVYKPTALERDILSPLGVDTAGWNRATIR